MQTTNVASMTISLFDRVENTMGKGENTGYQHFLPFPTVFSKAFFIRVVGLCGKEFLIHKSGIDQYPGEMCITAKANQLAVPQSSDRNDYS